jgi:hypothetical protein
MNMIAIACLFLTMALGGTRLAETETDPDSQWLCGFISAGCLMWAIFFWVMS